MTAQKPDKLWITGIAVLLLSSLIFFIPKENGKDLIANGLFFVNYILVLIYLFILWINDRLRRGSNNLPHLFLLLNLALLSCYALDHALELFAPSTTWWTTLLIIAGINFTATLFFARMPFLLQGIVSFIAGVSLIAFGYLAILLAPGYLIGVLASFVIGLSLHLFVPAVYATYIIVFVVRANRINRRLKLFFFIGGLAAVISITQYAIRWHSCVNAINTSLSTAKATNNNLPEWISVAQSCPPSPMEETILKSVFADGIGYESMFGWLPRRNFNEKQAHDPLVVIAAAFSGATDLEGDQRFHILNALFDARHKTERRLWSGDDLVTTDITTDVQLWPQLHLSYTEANITVANPAAADSDRWNPSEEALYTFHLPEGAVVSALSLYIDGKEQKAILSTRQKADSAYTTIVGKERRDPSVVHWQEGNTVVARVFPVTAESRRFKLGITAPLEKTGRKLVYHSIGFDGPPATAAKSTVHILPMQPLIHPEWPSTYPLHWTLQCDDPGIATTTFQFDGKQYVTATPDHTSGPAGFRLAYLDLNSSWTIEEYASLLVSLANMPIYTSLAGDDLVKVTPANRDAIFAASSKRSFSLFPLHRITDAGHALLISKSTPNSPNLSDLNGSAFARQLQQWLDNGGQVRLYNIGDEISPYLRALRETGAIQYEKGDLYTLQSHLHHNDFPADAVAANEVLIEPAALVIRRTDDTTSRINNPSAPDHLLRLFAYRRILQQLKGHLPGNWPEADLDAGTPQVQMAQEAGIVSPVSSYVVLESQADYNRFNIQDNKNGLKNASLNGKGAVPEPGEWAILISILAVFAVIRFHRLRKQHP